MKKTLLTVLIFVVIMAVLLGVAALAQRNGVARQAGSAGDDAADDEAVSAYSIDERGATVIELLGDSASVKGRGATISGSDVRIIYPGTYRVEGTLTDGQILVDTGSMDGTVYLILNNAQVTCSSGPALYVKQADKTVLHLPEGTTNQFTDSAGYSLEDRGEYESGAAIFSEDDLVIEGPGRLAADGKAADGIRSKDKVKITGGALNVTGKDDGIQAAEKLTVENGTLLVGSGGDGLTTTKGKIEISGGSIYINSTGDAVSAATELNITGGSFIITTFDGSEKYAELAKTDISAKGLKAEDITITGGSFDIDSADDGIHAKRSAVITGGTEFTIAAGDDGVSAAETLTIRNVAVLVTYCYEGIQADSILLGNIWLGITADHAGVDAGETGFMLEGGTVKITAPRILSADGPVDFAGGTVTATADGTDSLFSMEEASVSAECTMQVYALSGSAMTLNEKGQLPASLMFILPSSVPEGTSVTLSDAAGAVLYDETVTEANGGVLLYAGGQLGIGQTYTLTAGENTYEAELTEGCTVTQPAGRSGSGEMRNWR